MILSTTDWMQVVDWSRAQFAMTAIYHWLFVPLTLGLGIICAIMESIYYRTGNEFWKRTTKFWMRIFGINFAIGVATGIILEFEFENDSRCYADREIDPENPHPELRRPFPKLVAGTVIDALHDRADDAETEGQRHEQPMVNGCHRKLRARPVDHLHPVGSR